MRAAVGRAFPAPDAIWRRGRDAIASADRGLLERLLGEVREGLRTIHDSQAEWCWALLTMLRDELGEERMDDVFRRTQERWVTARYDALERCRRGIFRVDDRGHARSPFGAQPGGRDLG